MDARRLNGWLYGPILKLEFTALGLPLGLFWPQYFVGSTVLCCGPISPTVSIHNEGGFPTGMTRSEEQPAFL